MGDHKNLKVWHRAHAVALDVYRCTQRFPESELYGLTAQMRRAAVSITANIAQSRGRFTIPDQTRLLRFAQGSARELESHSCLARDLGLLPPSDAESLLAGLAEVERMLSALVRNSRPSRPEL